MRRLLGGNRCGDGGRRRNGGRGDHRCGITAVPGGNLPRRQRRLCTEPNGRPSPPVGATTMCGDGTYSFSQNRSGTCSHHEGVAQWLTGAPAHAVPALPAAAIPPPIDDSDEFVALAISPNTGLVGCDTRQLAQDLRPGLFDASGPGAAGVGRVCPFLQARHHLD